MHLPQAPGQRPIRVAEGGEWKHFSDPRAALYVVRGHRLEKAGAHLRSADGSMKITYRKVAK
jgi:hypothetical protein